jgi:serine/threonine protein kinase
MDYCDCGALDKFITNETSTYTLVNALNWSYQLADALSFLHSKNIMHRDVKMQNILLKDNYQNIVLTDYGTATNLGRNLLTNNVGTPIIMAPEVFRGTLYAEQCDIYSWSIVFWQLLSKQFSPYEDQNINKYSRISIESQLNIVSFFFIALVMKVLSDKLRPPKLNNCPELFVALLYRSWHSNPIERPSLSFIKIILRLILNMLPKTQHDCSSEVIDEVKRQCTNDSNTLEKYFPYQPRLNNERSKYLYEEHSNKLKFISDMKHEISQLDEQVQEICEQNKSKRDHHKQLLEENQILKEQIKQLRASKAT